MFIKQSIPILDTSDYLKPKCTSDTNVQLCPRLSYVSLFSESGAALENTACLQATGGYISLCDNMVVASSLATVIFLFLILMPDKSIASCVDNPLTLNGCEIWWEIAGNHLKLDRERLKCLQIMKKYCGESFSVTVTPSSGQYCCLPLRKPQAKVKASYGVRPYFEFVANQAQITAAGFEM